MTHYEEKMAAARAMVVFKAPYFASVVYGFVFQAVPGIKTMLVTAKLVLGFDPQWATEASVAHLATDIYHEVNHFVRRHFERASIGVDAKLWNYAGDIAINQDIRLGGWDYHDSYVFPEHFDLPLGKSTEEYYDLLRQQQSKSGSSGGGQPQKPKPQQPSDAQAPAAGPPPPNDGKTPWQAGGIGGGQCGGLGGHSANPDIEAEIDGEPDLGRTPAEIKSIEKRVIEDIRQHALAHGRGSLPSNLRDLLKAFEDTSCVRWQDELAGVLRDATGRMQSGGDDYSRARPSKRSIMRGVVRPSMVEYLPEIAFIRDSSGSMGAPQLTAACREGYAVMQALGIDEVWFGDADTRMSMPWKRVGPAFFRSLTERHGGGGTDFNQPLASAMRLSPRPDIIVYLTDGDGSVATCSPPGASVVWCIVPGHYNKAPADWGHVVIISDDPKQRGKKVRRPKDAEDEEDEP